MIKQLKLSMTGTRALSAVVMTATGLLFSGYAIAGSAVESGKQKAATCVACHGEDGKGTSAEFPILAGQYASYLEQALLQYKNGERKNAIMAGFAAGLSEKDIKDLAAYYASMKSSLMTPKP